MQIHAAVEGRLNGFDPDVLHGTFVALSDIRRAAFATVVLAPLRKFPLLAIEVPMVETRRSFIQ